MASSPAGTLKSHVANQQQPKKYLFCIQNSVPRQMFISKQLSRMASLCVHRYSIYFRKVPLLHISLAAAFICSVVFAVLGIKLSPKDFIVEQNIYCKTSCLTASQPEEDGSESAALSWWEEKHYSLFLWPFLHNCNVGLEANT